MKESIDEKTTIVEPRRMGKLISEHIANMPLIVATVLSYEDWQRMARQEIDADLVEWRMDALCNEIEAGKMSRAEIQTTSCAYPVLVTVRSETEGGLRAWSEGERRLWMEFLLKNVEQVKAIDIEVAFLDEFADMVELAHTRGVEVIASAHDFKATPSLEALGEKIVYARARGADVVKFAFMLVKEDDIELGDKLLQMYGEREDEPCGKRVPLAVMGMGAEGTASRLRYAKEGSLLVYGCAGDVPAAPGQVPSGEFRRLLKDQAKGEVKGETLREGTLTEEVLKEPSR